MKRFFFLLLLATLTFASSCDQRLFTLKAMRNGGAAISIKDVLRDISNECGISILFEDRISRYKIEKQLDFINIEDYTLEDLFDFLLSENNLFYTYDPQKALLKISYYKTKNFNVDYINLSSMVSESRKSVVLGTTSNSQTQGGSSVGSSGGTTTGGQEGQNGEANDYTTITTKSEFTFWNSLEHQLSMLLSGISAKKDFKIFINKDASLVTVTGTKKELEAVESFLNKLADRMHKQVLIEAKLIEVIYKDAQTIGIDWSQFSFTLGGSREAYKSRQNLVKQNFFRTPNYFIGYNFSMSGLFDFLKKYGDVKVLSNPKILTLNNQPAIINVGDQLSYRYETSATTNVGTTGTAIGTSTFAIGQSFVGITLYVIPEITDNNEIIMKINPVTSELLNSNETNSSIRRLPPDIKIKQLTSIVKVKDGQKILIGGLVSKRNVKDNNKVPILGDVPVIGRLFHSTKKDLKRSELFILIVPKIVQKNALPTIDELKIFGEGSG